MKKHVLIIFSYCFFTMYKLHIYQDEYWQMYDRKYPITFIMPNNGEKENNISKNQLICDIVNNTHKCPLGVFEGHYIYFRNPCMTHAIIPSMFTEKVCEFPSHEAELKKPSSLLTIVLDGYGDLINKQANKFQSFLSNCFNKLGHKVQIIIIKCEVLDYPIPKPVRKDMRNNIVLHFTETSKVCKLYWEGKISPLYVKKLPK